MRAEIAENAYFPQEDHPRSTQTWIDWAEVRNVPVELKLFSALQTWKLQQILFAFGKIVETFEQTRN